MAPQLVPYLLFLHVLGAILAFGPTFAYSIMGSMAGKEPQYANFSTRQSEAIGNRLVYPLAVGIVLYLITLIYALTIQRTAVHHLIELTSTPPAPGSPPNPEIAATVKR